VDGFINTTPFSSTTINLSRSLNLLDSATDPPELNAQVLIVGADGVTFPLIDTAANGNCKHVIKPGPHPEISDILHYQRWK
jgi:hypothetical protein